MKFLSLLVFLPFLLLFQPAGYAREIDYGVWSATPYNSEIALGRERLEKFLQTANAKKRTILAQNPVVAVDAAVVPASETGGLFRRILRGEFGGMIGTPADMASRPVLFVLVFDSRTGQLVTDDGVLVVSPPRRGTVGLFGGVSALYIGPGW